MGIRYALKIVFKKYFRGVQDFQTGDPI